MSKENKTVELNDKQLEKVSGGDTYADISRNFDYSKYEGIFPNVNAYTSNGEKISLLSIIERIADHRCFICVGYVNNNDDTTTYTFVGDDIPENVMFVASKSCYTMSDYRI